MASGSGGIPYVGSRISLISKAQIRYEGLLYSVNREESTIALSKVQSFGTEQREARQHVPPRQEVYEFIIFKADDIAELTVNEPPAPQLQDPAIVSVSQQKPAPIGSKGGADLPARQPQQQQQGFRQPQQQGYQQQQRPPVNHAPPTSYRAAAAMGVPPPLMQQKTHPPRYYEMHGYGGEQRNGQQHQWNNNRGGGGRGGYNQPQHQGFNGNRGGYNQAQRGAPRGRGRGGAQQQARAPQEKLKFDTEYDFETANENFEKAVKLLADGVDKVGILSTEISIFQLDAGDEGGDGVEDLDENADTGAEVFYDKTKSFFDTISCEAIEKEEGRSTRPDWAKERETNGDTFGVNSVRQNNAQRGRYMRGRGYGGGRGRGYHNNNRNNNQQQQRPQAEANRA